MAGCLLAGLLACFFGTKHGKPSKMEMSSEILWSIYLHRCTGMHMHMPNIPTSYPDPTAPQAEANNSVIQCHPFWPGIRIQNKMRLYAFTCWYVYMYVTTRIHIPDGSIYSTGRLIRYVYTHNALCVLQTQL